MKTRFLFPYYFKWIGLVCIFIHLPIMHLKQWNHWHFDKTDPDLFSAGHIFYITTFVVMVLGLLMVAFSKEKVEDEQISQLRLDSLQWAVYLNYFLIIVSLVFFRKADIYDILNMNLWVPLVFFIIRFRWVLYRLNRSLVN